MNKSGVKGVSGQPSSAPSNFHCKVALDRHGVIVSKVAGEPAAGDVIDDVLIAVEVADRAAVDDVVQAKLPGVDRRRDGTDRLHVGLPYLRVVDKLIQTLRLKQLLQTGIVVEAGSTEEVSFEDGRHLHEELSFRLHLAERLLALGQTLSGERIGSHGLGGELVGVVSR